jgi:hypothetical protein
MFSSPPESSSACIPLLPNYGEPAFSSERVPDVNRRSLDLLHRHLRRWKVDKFLTNIVYPTNVSASTHPSPQYTVDEHRMEYYDWCIHR